MNSHHTSTPAQFSSLVTLVAVLLVTAGNAQAQDTTTSINDGNFFDNANWDNGVPSPTIGTTTVEVNSNLTLSTGIGTINHRIIVGASTTDPTFTIDGGTLLTNTSNTTGTDLDDIIGNAGGPNAATVLVSNGGLVSFNSDDDVIIGNAGDDGTLQITSGTIYFHQDDDVFIGNGNGNNRIGLLDVDGGYVEFKGDEINIGQAGNNTTTRTGELNISGGTVWHDADDMRFGTAGGVQAIGILNMSGGVLTSNDFIYFGYNTGTDPDRTGFSRGLANVTGGIIQLANDGSDIIVGRQGVGSFNLNGGTILGLPGGADLRIAEDGRNLAGVGTGFFNLQSGLVQVQDTTIGGNNADGSFGFFNQSGGTFLGEDALIGVDTNIDSVTAGPNAVWTQSGGLSSFTNSVQLGGTNGSNLSAANATMNLTGGQMVVNDNFRVGNAFSNAALNVNGGTLVTGADLNGNRQFIVGDDAASEGTVTLASGVIAHLDNDEVRIGNNGRATWIQSGGLASVNANFRVARGDSSTASVNLSGGTIISEQEATIGYGNHASQATDGAIWVQNGGLFDTGTNQGQVASGQDLEIAGNSPGSRATINLSGGTLGASGDIRFDVGVSTTNIIRGLLKSNSNNNAGGNNANSRIDVASGGLSTHVITISGGTIDASSDLRVGLNGVATMNITDAAFVKVGGGNNGNGSGVTGDFEVGVNAGSTGHVSQTGGTVLLVDAGRNLIVGQFNGVGTYEFQGGYFENADTGGVIVGNGSATSTANGTLLINGGTFLANPAVSSEDGGTNPGGNLNIQNWSSGNASVNISGANTFVRTAEVNVGNGVSSTNNETGLTQGTAVLEMEGGDLFALGDINVGNNDDTNGVLNVSGGTIRQNSNGQDLRIGVSGSQTEDGDLNLADARPGGARGTVNQSGGLINIRSNVELGVNADQGGGGGGAHGVYNLSGGTLRAGRATNAADTGSLRIGRPDDGSFATFDMSGGVLRVQQILVNNAGGNVNNTHSFTGGVISATQVGTGGLGLGTLEIGGGTMTLSGATIDMSPGADDNILAAIAATDALIISSGNVYNSSLTDIDITQTGGRIEISEDGTNRVMDFNGNDLDSSGIGSQIVFDIFSGGGTGGLNALGDANYLDNIGTLDLDGTTILVMNDNNATNSLSFIRGDAWDLLDVFGAGTIAPTILAVNLPALSEGLLWDTSTFAINGIITVVPEPSRAIFLIVGFSLALFHRRRSRTTST